jgi:hypothetical protein
VGERANALEAQCHPDQADVDATGRWSESPESYSGRPRLTLERATSMSGRPRRSEESAASAAAKVAPAHGSEGPNRMSRTGPIGSGAKETRQVWLRCPIAPVR